MAINGRSGMLGAASTSDLENDFTNRNTTFMTWNLLHLARMLKDAGGIPAHGNQRSEWDAGCRFDFRSGERLHQSQHHVHDVEPAPPGSHAQGRRWHPGPWQSTVGVGCWVPLRLPIWRTTSPIATPRS